MCGLDFTCLFCFPDLPQVLAENYFVEVAVHGMFWKFIVPEEKWGEFHKILEKFCRFWDSKEKGLHVKQSGCPPYSESPALSPQSQKTRNYQQFLTVLCMRTCCKLWKFCPSSHPATDGKALRMARAGGWRGHVYFNKDQRLKFHQCPSAVTFIHLWLFPIFPCSYILELELFRSL